MGYDMTINKFKRKDLEELKKKYPEYSFQTLYYDYLSLYAYYVPDTKNENYIIWSNVNLFEKFFEPKLDNGNAIIIEEPTYNEMINYLECQLKYKNLCDLIFISDDEKYEYKEMMKVYKKMLEVEIDWDTEFVVYQHDW